MHVLPRQVMPKAKYVWMIEQFVESAALDHKSPLLALA